MYSDRADVWGCKKPEPDADVSPASDSSEEISTRIVEDYLELLKPFVQQIERLNTRIKELEDARLLEAQRGDHWIEKYKELEDERDGFKNGQLQNMVNDLMDVNTKWANKVRELEESDSWMLSAKEFLENGGCPICFTTDEAGHTKECVWGQTEMKVKELVEGIERFKEDWIPEPLFKLIEKEEKPVNDPMDTWWEKEKPEN